ncbi:PREDICTED: lymphocyte antigen 6 complex locus protein G6d-like isoform X2 [Acropora digitifera]|uniref:lymphocyte antigen 6 complex locus protein G6d-like isoform X2 n=1 Tax=Acropora digitifera TaxID=70779 RepID=UPI00077AE575|nr:PREDICTED: lymphocyte antigen 6 complex locus protein G6d-like isoform X2 [Acropora digitifera]
MKFLHIFAFLLCVSVGHSLKCYFCISSSSWDDCKTQEITCPSLANRCGKIYTKEKIFGNTVSGYAKTCVTESSCKDYKSAPACQKAEECKLDCCSGDLCNTAAMQVVSVVFLVLCAFLASVMTQ